jgi:hypothetical protein
MERLTINELSYQISVPIEARMCEACRSSFWTIKSITRAAASQLSLKITSFVHASNTLLDKTYKHGKG